MLSAFVMFVAAVAVPPETALMAIRTTGESASGSLNVAVSVTTEPCLYAVCEGEYVIAAVGAVVSAKTPDVSGGVNVSEASFPAASFIVPPFRLIGEELATAPLSPTCKV